MLSSVRAFLSQLIDYAGMFPPAKLPLEDALANYVRYRDTSPHAWMLGRFVCPAARLSDISSPTLHVTVLATLPQLEADLCSIDAFRGRGGTVDSVEFVLEVDTDPRPVSDQLGRANLHVFFEVSFNQSWRHGIDRLTTMRGFGLKLRCGGLSAEAFPSAADVAHFIGRCRDASIAWKATAGLHHPRRHWDASLHLWHHGFLNVFGAGILAQAHPLTEADFIAILSDRQAEHFHFDEHGLSWKNWTCTTAQIEQFRASATSFGSCSFDEPCADLVAMGLLEKAD